MDYLGSEQPYGIRSNSGYLLFFPRITKYEGQDERHNKEVSEAFILSEIIIKALKATKMKAKQPIENFFDDEVFYENLGEYLDGSMGIERAEDLADIPSDFTKTFQLSQMQPMFQMNLVKLANILLDWHEDSLPEDCDLNIIDNALKESIDFDRLNSLIPKYWYTNGEFVTVTKQNLIDYFD